MSDFDHPTHRLVQLIAEHLAGMGQTNVRTTERWEGDGVHHVWSDQATHATENVQGMSVRYGWTLDVCGNDNPRFSAGVDFSYVSQERLVPVASWSDLDRLIAAC